MIRPVIQLIKAQYNKNFRIIRLDWETSLIQECQRLATEYGINFQISAPHTLEQNDSAERSGGVIIVKAKAIALEVSLKSKYWFEIVICTSYISN